MSGIQPNEESLYQFSEYVNGDGTIGFDQGGDNQNFNIVNATKILCDDGLTSNVSFGFKSDVDTGLYRVGANTLGISTNGGDRVRIYDSVTEFFNILRSKQISFSENLINCQGLLTQRNIDWDTVNNSNVYNFWNLGVGTVKFKLNRIPTDGSRRGQIIMFCDIFGELSSTKKVQIECYTDTPANDQDCIESYSQQSITLELPYDFVILQASVYGNASGGANRLVWKILNWRHDMSQSFGRLLLNGGTSSSPALSFSSPETGTNSGIYNRVEGEVNISTNNNERVRVADTLTTLYNNLNLPLGTNGSPSLRFGDVDTGFYSNGSGAINVSSNGTERMFYFEDTIGLINNTQLRLINGSNARPSIGWADASNNWDSGIYRQAEDVISVSTASTERLRVANSETVFYNRIRNIDGTMALPSYAFTSSVGSGMYMAGAQTLAFSINGNQKIAIIDGTGATNHTHFNTNLNIPAGDSTNPCITINGSQTLGMYADFTNSKLFLKVGTGIEHRFEQVSSEIPSQLSTRAIIHRLNLLSTASNQTLSRLDSINYGTFMYELTANIDVQLPTSMTSADVGLIIRIGKNSGAFSLTVKTNGTDLLNNSTTGTTQIASGAYTFRECLLVKVVSGVSHWVSQI